MDSYSAQQVPNRADLIDIDMNLDGVFDHQDEFDVRLKWFYIDNTHIAKLVDYSDEFVLEERGITDTYIGYDQNNNGQISDDQCYFRYIQASFSGDTPEYDIVDSGC